MPFLSTFVMREIDSFDSPYEDNFSRKLSIPGDVSILFRLTYDFPNLDQSIDWASLVEKQDFLLLFEGVVNTRTVPAILVLLRSSFLDLLTLSLKPDLSVRQVGKHNLYVIP